MPVLRKAVQGGQELLRLEDTGVRLGGREILRNVSFTARASRGARPVPALSAVH